MSKIHSKNIYQNPNSALEYFSHIQINPINLNEQNIVKGLFPELKGKYTLEIGCAGAIYSREMLSKNALKVDSMDYSLAMIEIAKKITKNEVSYKHQDINLNLDIKSKYDFICASYILHYSKTLIKTLTNIVNGLKRRGLLVFSVPNPELFKEGENLFSLGDKKIPTNFYNHPETLYIETLSNLGTVIKVHKDENVLIIKFRKN